MCACAATGVCAPPGLACPAHCRYTEPPSPPSPIDLGPPHANTPAQGAHTWSLRLDADNADSHPPIRVRWRAPRHQAGAQMRAAQAGSSLGLCTLARQGAEPLSEPSLPPELESSPKIGVQRKAVRANPLAHTATPRHHCARHTTTDHTQSTHRTHSQHELFKKTDACSVGGKFLGQLLGRWSLPARPHQRHQAASRPTRRQIHSL